MGIRRAVNQRPKTHEGRTQCLEDLTERSGQPACGKDSNDNKI